MFGQHGLVLLFVLILVVVVLVFGLKYLRMWIDQCNYKNAREDDAQARRKIALDTKDASQLDVRVMTSTGWTRPASAWPWVGRSPVGRPDEVRSAAPRSAPPAARDHVRGSSRSPSVDQVAPIRVRGPVAEGGE